MKRALISIFLFLPILTGCKKLLFIDNEDFLIVTEYIKPNTGEDVSKHIQRLIDNNPNRTLYFPDGEYCISSQIITSANPNKSVSLHLSNYAVIKAIGDWSHGHSMIALGAKDPTNNIFLPGSNYYLCGGIIDGSGVAKGISIDSGRETVVRDISLKNVTLGIHILIGVNNGSSDADINNVNIVGTDAVESIGLLVEGGDNTFTNLRIAKFHVGVKVLSTGNHFSKVHPLYYGKGEDNYESSCGFIDEAYNNWYDFCYSDEFATGFYIKGGHHSSYNNCYVFWYSNRGETHLAFKTDGVFNAHLTNFHVAFYDYNYVKNNVVLSEGEDGGNGIISNLYVDNKHYLTDETHLKYIK